MVIRRPRAVNRFDELAPVLKVLPLVHVIAREIQERRSELQRLERTLAHVPLEPCERRIRSAECAVHRRELRLAWGELQRLGCVILSHAPLTVAISRTERGSSRCLIWQP